MIRNQREYLITKSQLEAFQRDLEVHRAAPRRPNVDPRLKEAELEAMQAQIDTMLEDIRQYESLQKGPRTLRSTFDNLGVLLIQARTARGWSQRELAERLGLHMQKIQEYEKTDYERASLTRLLDVARVLGMTIDMRATLIELPDRNVLSTHKATRSAAR